MASKQGNAKKNGQETNWRDESRRIKYLIAFRVSYTQRADVRAAAKAAKLTVSEYILRKLDVRDPKSTKIGGAK